MNFKLEEDAELQKRVDRFLDVLDRFANVAEKAETTLYDLFKTIADGIAWVKAEISKR